MSLSKQHIVIVTSEFPPQPGGIGNHAYNLALNLTKNEFTVEVIADQRSENGIDEEVFDNTLPFTVTRIKRHKLRFKMYVKRIWVTYRSFKKTSCIIATGKFSLWNVGFLSLFKKAQTIAVIHGTEVNFKPFFLRKSIDLALSEFDNVVAVSNFTKQLVSHIKKEVVVIPNGIDLNNWKLETIDGVKLKGQPTLTTVGRVSSRKGQLNVIKQLPDLLKSFPLIHYHCIGIPTEANAFLSIAKEIEVERHVTFHGSLDDRNLKQFLQQTDIFIMLSSEDTSGDVEGFGIAILEANALGVPAIGSKGCGIEDAISASNSGQLVEFDNVKQLLSAIGDILNNKSQYQNEAKKWAQKHDWSNVINQYIALVR